MQTVDSLTEGKTMQDCGYFQDNICPPLSEQRLKGFFNDATSFNIAIDMLFTKGQYKSKCQNYHTVFCFPPQDVFSCASVISN